MTKKKSNSELAEEILEMYGTWLCVLGETEKSDVLLYDCESGIYVPGKLSLESKIDGMLGKKSTTGSRREVYNLVHLRARGNSATRRSPDDFDNDRNIIVYANGTYMVKERKLDEFSPEHYCRIRLPFDFDPGATCPLFKTFLSQVLAPEYHKLIEEILGCALIGDNRFEKVPLLVGAGRNGKSVLLKVIGELVGKENISNLPLMDLAGNNFAIAGLHGKKVNAFADIENLPLKHQGILKSLVSGDPITADRKYLDPITFNSKAVMIFACNDLPSFGAHTFSIERRLIPIDFGRTFSEKEADINLTDKLTTSAELSGIGNLALKGYKRLLDQNVFSIPAESQKLLEAHLDSTDSVALFINECIRKDPDHFIPKQELYDEYVGFCQGGDYQDRGAGLRPLSRPKFNKRLKQQMPFLEEGRVSSSDRREAWRGITYDPQNTEIRTASGKRVDISSFLH